jgi:Ca-activated chloride channel family protein
MVFRLLAVAAVLSMLGAMLPTPAEQPVAAQESTPAAGNQPGTQVNVELMLDSSGSMADETNTGEPRIDAAKRVLTDVIAAIPSDRPEINVGFRVFGHKGNNTQAGREESCQSSDLTVKI